MDTSRKLPPNYEINSSLGISDFPITAESGKPHHHIQQQFISPLLLYTTKVMVAKEMRKTRRQVSQLKPKFLNYDLSFLL